MLRIPTWTPILILLKLGRKNNVALHLFNQTCSESNLVRKFSYVDKAYFKLF